MNLYEFSQKDLEIILSDPKSLRSRFTDNELIRLIETPQFKRLDRRYKDIVWDTIGYIFNEDLKQA